MQKNDSIVLSIIDNYDNFTSVEKVIADYFIENRTHGDFSIKSMKDNLFVSEASLSRFAKKCGFRGYREFIYKYEEGFIKTTNPRSAGFQDVFNTYHLLLNQSLDMIDEAQIRRLSMLIAGADYVLVCGIGSSGLAAKEMKLRFMRLGILVECSDQSDEMRMQAVILRENSLVIGMSIGGKKDEILFALKQAHKNNAKTVLITANNDVDYDFVDELVLVPSFRNLDYGNIISPQFPLQIVVDVCYQCLLEQDTVDRARVHQKTIDVLLNNE